MCDISGKTVYMVSTGEYSSFYYVAAFSSRMKADAFAAGLPLDEIAKVHEWVIDDELISDTHGLFPYYVEMASSGDVSVCKRLTKRTVIRWNIRKEDGNYLVNCMARNEQHAAKVAMEQVMQYKAKEES